MAKFNNPTKVITGVDTRWSYANVWDPKSINGGTPKYSISLIIPKSDKVTIQKIKAAIQAIFSAKVKSVNTRNVQRKIRRIGRYEGFLPQYKKAIVRFDSSFDLGKITAAVANEEQQANEADAK